MGVRSCLTLALLSVADETTTAAPSNDWRGGEGGGGQTRRRRCKPLREMARRCLLTSPGGASGTTVCDTGTTRGLWGERATGRWRAQQAARRERQQRRRERRGNPM